jgi:hypothetical protein
MKKHAPKIKVSYYNKTHKKLLEKTPKFSEIDSLVQQGYYINEDFWIYSMFTDKKDYDGFRTFDDITEIWMEQYKYTGRYINLSHETVKAKLPGETYSGLSITERIGVAGGLSVISSIHDLTEADWEVIPISKTKDLDFEIASDGKNIIEVECKGTYGDTSLVSSSMSQQKTDIEEKKQVQRAEGNKNLLYGVITSFSKEEKIMAHSRLLDPVSNTEYDDPYKLRILSRLKFYLKEIRKFSRSHFLIALANRINVISSTKGNSYLDFDKLALVNASDSVFKYPISLENNKSIINSSNNTGFGNIAHYDNEEYFVFGFDRKIVEILINQDFLEIVNYKTTPETFSANIEGKIKEKDSKKAMPIKLNGNLQVN